MSAFEGFQFSVFSQRRNAAAVANNVSSFEAPSGSSNRVKGNALAMLVTLHTRRQPIHFFTTEHRWQFFITAVNATDRNPRLRVSER